MKPRILIVDDTPMCRLNAINSLLCLDIIADEAYCAEDALKLVGRKSYDLILMDHDMPGMSGIECTREIRRRECGTGAHIAIVGFTGNENEGVRDDCLKSGMDDVLVKGAMPIELVEIVSRWLPAGCAV